MTFVHLDDVLAEVAPLGRLFAAEGYRLFLVGGIVRDQLLDFPLDGSSDIDLTTDALPAEIKRIVMPVADDLWAQGEKFGTIGLRSGGRDYEITTHRAESYTSDSRKPVVSFGDEIETDLSRRDFTVNAMAIELPDGDLVDPFGGAVDLESSVLRTPMSPEISFTDDPLRMLRAARFATKYSLWIDLPLTQAADALSERLRIVAIERIGVEMQRLLALHRGALGLQFLFDTGLLAEVLCYGAPDLMADATERLGAAIEAADRLTPADGPASWKLRLAAMGLRVFDDATGVQALCQRLRLSRDDEREITGASRSATWLLAAEGVDQPMVRRWNAECADPDAAVTLAQALADDPASAARIDTFIEARHALLASEPVTAELLDGEAIMQLLGVRPGPVIGEAHAMLRQHSFDHGPASAEEQRDQLRTWWAERST